MSNAERWNAEEVCGVLNADLSPEASRLTWLDRLLNWVLN